MGKLKSEITPLYIDNISVLNFVTSIPSVFDKKGNILYDKRNTIKEFRTNLGGIPLNRIIVKRYKRPSFIQRIIYSFLRRSKAQRAFVNAQKLRERGIDTPHEIAYAEEWVNGMFLYGYYISATNLNPPIKEKLIVPENFDREMAQAFAAFAAQLHEKGILHHDLNSTNVLYQVLDGKYVFSVIDINRMDFRPKGKQISRKECFENMARFTGKMDLYQYVLQHYVAIRGWDEDILAEAIEVKMRHDERWRRRKAFLRKLKSKK